MNPLMMMLASLGSSALGGIGSYFTGKEASDSAKKAAREQLQQMQQMSQWGWGYPDWLKSDLQNNVNSAGQTADKLMQMYKDLSRVYTSGLGENPLADPTRAYVRALSAENTLPWYQSSAKEGYNQGMRALEEIPGMTAGARVSAQSELASKLGSSITQAMIQAEQDRINRLGLGFNAESASADLEWKKRVLENQLLQQYGQLGMSTLTAGDELKSNALRTAYALPNRYSGNTYAASDAPSLTASLLQSLGKGVDNMALLYAMYGKTPNTSIPQNTGGSYPLSNPYTSSYNPYSLGVDYTLRSSFPQSYR